MRRPDSATCSALLAELLAGYPHHANLGAISTDGELTCSALPTSGRIYLGDRAYFKRALATRDFAAGDYQVGRITGKSTLNFGYPVLDDGGKVSGVVYAALDLAWVNRMASEAKLSQGSTLALLDAQGTVLARYPDADTWVGKSAAESPSFKLLMEPHGQGTVQALARTA